MENILIGKALKAMQKLSGLSVGDLADATGLTIDTVNNLFYARVQKPGFANIYRMVECMGFSMEDFMFVFKLPDAANMEIADIMEQLTLRAEGIVPAAEIPVSPAKKTAPVPASGSLDYDALEQHNERMNELHEKQLDRFKATHLNYVAQLREQYNAQLEQAEEHSRVTIQGLEKLVDEQRERVRFTVDRYEKQVAEMRSTHEITEEAQRQHIDQLKKINNWLIAIASVSALSTLISLLIWLTMQT